MKNNISEPLCSFEVSKLLKEKGCECQNGRRAYSLDGKSTIDIYSSFYTEDKYPIQDISHALAIEWIWINFEVRINASLVIPYGKKEAKWRYSLDKFCSGIIEGENSSWIGDLISGVKYANSSYEATEEALKYFLINIAFLNIK